jgi:hypothetical protein
LTIQDVAPVAPNCAAENAAGSEFQSPGRVMSMAPVSIVSSPEVEPVPEKTAPACTVTGEVSEVFTTSDPPLTVVGRV